jgi:Methyltransferase domain
MLGDATEIAIATSAKQKNIRDPRRDNRSVRYIIRDFFQNVDLSGRCLDLGPGQFDFANIVRARGGSCLGVDFDPIVVALGRHKGFEVVEMNIRQLSEHEFGEAFDGVFNKFALNAFWHWDDQEAHAALVAAIAELVRPGGWGWIGPWNGVPKKAKLDQVAIDRTLDLQRQLFEQHGFAAVPLTQRQSRRYGVHGNVANNVVFVKNLEGRPQRWARPLWP